ncbi:putative manganese efflux pump MntP [Bacteroidia bacterium]|nr:putative manganese efflux pump MntP [Bacteroidia bacterium]
MSIIAILLLAASLCFDSLAVSISGGLAGSHFGAARRWRFALLLAAFQGLMPFVGWCLGQSFNHYIMSFDHWIAFALLAFIGGRMIYEGLHPDHPNKKMNYARLRTQLLVALATSIDALAVGMSFAFMPQMSAAQVLQAAFIIGGVTFVVTVSGVFLGTKIGRYFSSQKAEIVGGIILIGIGAKILLEHFF